MLVKDLSDLYGRLLTGLVLVACAILFIIMIIICLDVLLRNVPLIPGVRSIAWSNEVNESMLYLITMLSAPWLLRQGQHIRVDVVLRAIPKAAAWYCELLCDVLALACCLIIAVYGALATASSIEAGTKVIKVLILPDWWSLAPLPVTFGLLAIEVVFRMHRLLLGERGPRDDAVSSA